MIIIRGATTIDKDSKIEIQEAIKELLDTIFIENALKKEEISGILFSLTSDIHSYHPCKAAREVGYDFAPLFACLEPEIIGGLPLTIRVMLFTNQSDLMVQHIYLKGAKVLRKDLSGIMNIALDGPAGSGKSTVAKLLAKDYHILYLDTGAMYRACALFALKNHIDPKDEEEVKKNIEKMDIKVEYLSGTQHTFLGDLDVSEEIRKNEVSLAASNIAAHKVVREKMVEMQRSIAKRMSCVLDGRDIGSFVLPDASFKFYITADSSIRAKRRYDELILRNQKADYSTILEEIIARDKQDKERKISPLVQAKDAILVDTSNMTIEEVVLFIKHYIQSQI